MDIKGKIISISGNARCGKDTVGSAMVEILSELGIQAQKISFAHELRRSLDSLLIKELGISAFTEKDEEKSLIRPLLVTWGTDVMRKHDEDVWIKKIYNSLDSKKVNIICDLRFENELNWVKENDGASLFLDREGILPANKYEEENNEILKSQVDMFFSMYEVSDKNMMKCLVNEILNNLINEEKFELWKATCH